MKYLLLIIIPLVLSACDREENPPVPKWRYVATGYRTGYWDYNCPTNLTMAEEAQTGRIICKVK